MFHRPSETNEKRPKGVGRVDMRERYLNRLDARCFCCFMALWCRFVKASNNEGEAARIASCMTELLS